MVPGVDSGGGDYDRLTRSAYQTPSRAAAYRRHQSEEWSWARLVTVREQRLVARLMQRETWRPTDLILDAPCGTGVLGPVLRTIGCRVVAADISLEMMGEGRSAYDAAQLAGFVQADLTSLALPAGVIGGVVTLGFMHRVPAEIRRRVLLELARLEPRAIVVSYSLDTPSQRLKKWLWSRLRPGYVPAPNPARRDEVEAEIRASGLRVVEAVAVLPLLSAEYLFLLEPGPQ